MNWKSPIFWSLVGFTLSVGIATLGPEEAVLGKNVRVVYFHGAWVWTALGAFSAAAILGLLALLSRRENLHFWSSALGHTGLFFWVTYLPLSLWAMQANWNGLFLAEPRWRFALTYTITGILLQLGLSFLPLVWSSLGNVAYIIALYGSMAATENVMHPPGPMLESDFSRIQIFFFILTALLLFTASQVSRWLYKVEKERRKR